MHPPEFEPIDDRFPLTRVSITNHPVMHSQKYHQTTEIPLLCANHVSDKNTLIG